MNLKSMHPVFGTSPSNVRAVFSLSGSIDDDGLDALRDTLVDFAASTTGDIVIDCRNLTSISEPAAAVLLSFHRDMTTVARRVRIRAVPARCRESFESRQMNRLFGETSMPSRPVGPLSG